MLANSSIPLEPEEFDAPLVQRLIRTKHPDAVVTSMRVIDAALSTEGEQRVSTARRISVEVAYGSGAPKDWPTRLTVKVARPGLGDIPLYDNEVNVYAHLRDELPATAPRCLGAYRDAPSSSFGLVLEDLRTANATFPSVLTPTSLQDLRTILKQLALLHAAYWQSPRFTDDLAWVQPHTSGPIHDLFTHDAGVPMLVNLEVRTQQFKRELVESVGETVDSLRHKVGVAQRHQASLPLTLVHGDTHIGNTYRLPGGRAGLLDWQLTARGFCVHDVSYVIITGLSVSERRAHEMDMLRYYRQELVQAGVSDAPSVEDLRQEYRYAAAWCLYIGWLTTPLENYGWEISVANHIRLATAYRDLDSNTALANLESA